MNLIVYESPDALEKARFLGVFFNGSSTPLPIFFRGTTADAVRTAGANWLLAEQERLSVKAARPPPGKKAAIDAGAFE